MRLGLGTVQFGTDYGAANARGRVPRAEVAVILADAAKAGVTVIDTAPGYGDAEAVLGELLPPDHAFRIVTKTLPAAAMATDPDAVERQLDRSLAALRRDRIDTLLMHHAGALWGPHGAAHAAALIHARADGRVRRIGVSVYEAVEISRALELLPLDTVQLPVNVADQRLVASGMLAMLAARDIEVHARSLFLQGLLLLAPAALPAGFRPVAARFAAIADAARDAGLTSLQACLAFALSRPEITVPLVGVAGLAEWRGIRDAARVAESIPAPDFAGLGIDDEDWVDPSRWDALGRLAPTLP